MSDPRLLALLGLLLTALVFDHVAAAPPSCRGGSTPWIFAVGVVLFWVVTLVRGVRAPAAYEPRPPQSSGSGRRAQ